MERVVVPQRSIGQERLSFAATSRSSSTLERLSELINWTPGRLPVGAALSGQQRRTCVAAAGNVQGVAAGSLA